MFQSTGEKCAIGNVAKFGTGRKMACRPSSLRMQGAMLLKPLLRSGVVLLPASWAFGEAKKIPPERDFS
jgi:hypothetical protein